MSACVIRTGRCKARCSRGASRRPKVIRAIRFAAAALHSLSLTGTGSGAVEREVIANIMTICYTRNKKGLELIRAIPSLQALLKELEAAYDVSHG